MANRLSRKDKEKWVAEPKRSTRRPPVQIPDINTNALIEENKLTLIGRVTNPSIQKTRALVDFFLQHWRVKGQITGRALGPHMFQFRFETEQDLQAILTKAPYHFKRWMLILQRWEPIVSDFFPAFISFWISIHGIPLHYWTEDALKAIGKELGPVEDFDEDNGRVRVKINGLKPLEMKLDISLPSGEIKQVELEYEDLQKHCFLCLSLSHEREDCPTSKARVNTRERPRQEHSVKVDQRHEYGRPSARERLSFSKESGTAPQRGAHTRSINSGRNEWRPVTTGTRATQPAHSQLSHTPSPCSQREDASLRRTEEENRKKSGEGSVPSQERRSALERISQIERRTPSPIHTYMPHSPSPRLHSDDVSLMRTAAKYRKKAGESSIPSQERRSALERLTQPEERTPLLQDGVPNAASGRLQEVNICYLEDTVSPNQAVGSNRPSGSKPPLVQDRVTHGGVHDRSPIRTLSENRFHVSLRLGPTLDPGLISEELRVLSNNVEDSDSPQLIRATDKGKGKVSTTQAQKKRKGNCPNQGVNLSTRKRRVTKVQSSPKRRTCALTAQQRGAKISTAGTTQPQTTIIPPSRRKGADFRSGPKPLP
ncbi:hypothetical protein BRARA_I03822 [Brassica rapa]|uniref:DUF4283 domain-containing protein n=1 Tax=Brassica campestris TaxID=3711 RepID=A0A397Y646_BRACM|nr:hypothetical protein BRARA_I03822 [Brassica rapa]